MPDRTNWTQPQISNQGFKNTMKVIFATGSLGTADLALNRTTGVAMIPKGFVVQSLSVTVSDMDTSGSPALVLNLGDSGDVDRLITGGTLGQSAATVTTLAATGLDYEYPADTELQLIAATAAATAAAGTYTVRITGFMR